MPINTSYAGNIPWLITEPPSVALARGAQIGEGIARQRLQQQQINLQAAQQQEIAAHRQVQEGIEKAQEARQAAIFSKTTANELSRRIGMGMLADGMEIFHADNPDATPSDEAKAMAGLMLKFAPQIYPDGQGFPQAMQHVRDAIGRVGLNEVTMDLRRDQAERTREQTKALRLKEMDDWAGGGKPVTPGAMQKDVEFIEGFEKLSPEEKKKAQSVRVGLNDATATPGAIEKDLSFLDRYEKLTPEEKKKARDVRIGLEAKAGVQHVRSRAEYVDRHLTGWMSEHPMTQRAKAIKALELEYDRVYHVDETAPARADQTGAIKTYNPATGKLE